MLMVHFGAFVFLRRDVEIFFGMQVIWTDFENYVSLNEILSVKSFGLILYDITVCGK